MSKTILFETIQFSICIQFSSFWSTDRVIYKALCFDVAQGRMGYPMRLELTRVGLLVQLANRYTTRGAIDRTLSGVTTPGQSGPKSDDSEGVLRIPQSSSITGTSPSDFFSHI